MGGASGAPAKQQAKLSPPPVNWIGSVRYASPVHPVSLFKKLSETLRRQLEPRSGAPFMPHGIRCSSAAAAVAQPGAPPPLLLLLLAPGGGTGGAVVVGSCAIFSTPHQRSDGAAEGKKQKKESAKRTCWFHRFIAAAALDDNIHTILIWLSIGDRRTCAGTK